MYEIVGVAADVQYFASTSSILSRPMYFLPEAQSATFEERELQSREVWSHYPYNIVIWAPGNPPRLAADVRGALAAVAPDLVVRRIESYAEVVGRQFDQQNMLASLCWLFGTIGLVLAAVGVYGVTEYRVEQRTSEIGLRVALGAQRGSVVAMIVRGAFWQIGLGMALGIPAAIGGGLVIANQLFGVTAWDPMVLLVAVVLLTLATLVAAAVPARRAACVDPMQAVRLE
jgi:predicted lysophospholipase L1 biosynthesis ABC-type transport system permease subunit